jgi:aquaporin NIP
MLRKLLAEFLGTLIMIFAGTGAIVVNGQTGALGHVGVALAWGIVVMVLVYTLGHVSGAHMNPAVTITMLAAGKIGPIKSAAYIVTQCAGAIVASVLVMTILGSDKSLGATLPAGSYMQSFVLEFILTAVLLFVIFHVTSPAAGNNPLYGVAIGGTIGLEAMFAGPICGASMNPARSLGPALVSGNLSSLSLYLIAPVLGGLFGYLCYRLTREKQAA